MSFSSMIPMLTEEIMSRNIVTPCGRPVTVTPKTRNHIRYIQLHKCMHVTCNMSGPPLYMVYSSQTGQSVYYII